MSLYSFDASALIDLWDNYPIQNIVFKDLYDKFLENAKAGKFVISDVAIEEVRSKILYGQYVYFKRILDAMQVIKKTPSDLTEAQSIKGLLEIKEDNYGGGVGENDILIIAIAKRTQTVLVNNESRQPGLPQNKGNYKIPATCFLVRVESINLAELLSRPNLW